MRYLFALAAILILLSSIGSAQTMSPPPAGVTGPADTDYAPPEPVKETGAGAPLPATDFVMPDVPDGWNKRTAYDGRLFSTQLSLVPIVDYTWFTQDANSVSQVGAQKDEWDLRTFRIMGRGRLKFPHAVDYFVSLEIKGKDHVQTDASSLGFTDLYFSTSVGKLGKLSYGKLKEPWVYEMVGDAANLPQQERILSPFFVSRGIGLRLSKPIAHDRMTWSIGWFNDWWIEGEPLKDSSNQFAGRVTGLPQWADEGANYLHLAASVRRDRGAGGVLRFRGRPESNVASYYVDSGEIPSKHADELGLEALWGHGPWLVATESANAWIDTPASNDPRFWGAYVTVSYVLTGEHRPYDRQVAYARRVMPRKRWGAWEVFARYSHLDIDDRALQGGTLNRTTGGLSWWATRRWKLGVDYGLSDLDRFGISGDTNSLHMRLQWVY